MERETERERDGESDGERDGERDGDMPWVWWAVVNGYGRQGVPTVGCGTASSEVSHRLEAAAHWAAWPD